MSAFDRLNPALQHHIVNSLGWRELRPFQEAVIPPILDGRHLIVLAPTAGGKTEAAFFPLLSRMASEAWQPLSVLYLCPIKALLNNLQPRLERYSTLLGRRVGLWHGDVKPSQRKRILKEPPDCLLTTPESLELMLVSPRVDARALFCNLRAVIVDEIHAFAGDDRGWHLLSVLERASQLAGREVQRIGLSATVGNPDDLVDWLAGSCQRTRDVYLPPAETAADDADVKLDFVGSLQNAAVVIARLHQGEKRLVFVDSRSRAEQLAAELRHLQVTTFVTHSSLSQEQRHQAEEAFAARDNCVIVATSVLELGIDVGSLDRVIQIDSPPTVSSFLQRMGRTGRRSGTRRNCLFLATKDQTLVQSAALIGLWEGGYIEPVGPPPRPLHVLAQQLMALVLQHGGVGRANWFESVRGAPAFADLPREDVEGLVESMLAQDILWDDQGILGMGREGEESFGRRNFLDLLSVFTSPPVFSVLHGRRELGYVDVTTFLSRQEGPRVLLLAGQAWKVNHVDWPRKRAYVEPAEAKGRSRWSGVGQGLDFVLSQAIKETVTGTESSDRWSRRAPARLREIREEFRWLGGEGTTLLRLGDGTAEWWTHAGHRVNATLANELTRELGQKIGHDSFRLQSTQAVELDAFHAAIHRLSQREVATMVPAIDESAIEGLKFSACLPKELAITVLQSRVRDVPHARAILEQSVSVMAG